MTEKIENKINLFDELFIKEQTYKNIIGKKDLWQEVSRRLNGKFRIKHTVSRDLASFVLEIPYKNQLLILSESDTKPLKSEIELDLKEQFEFNISWEGRVEKIMKIFGSQDIQIGAQEFDKKYLIQSNKIQRTIDILLSLKEEILELDIYLINLYQEKKDKNELIVIKDRNTNSLEDLIRFIELNFRLIDNLIINS